jgi:hypothetical protein
MCERKFNYNFINSIKMKNEESKVKSERNNIFGDETDVNKLEMELYVAWQKLKCTQKKLGVYKFTITNLY